MPLLPADARPVLLWYRQDFRIDDHAALNGAAVTGRPVPMPVSTPKRRLPFKRALASNDMNLWHLLQTKSGWLVPKLEFAAACIRLGETYTRPIVAPAERRARALAALRVVTGRDS